jgi:hypothetical protein
MPASTNSQTGKKKSKSAAQPQTMQPLPTLPAGVPKKVRTHSLADPPVQIKQPSRYNKACKFLNASQLLAEGAPCSLKSVMNALTLLVETYRMPEKIAKALVHILEVTQQINSQCPGCANTLTIPGIIKEMQGNLSKEFKQKLSALESKITASPPASACLESATKEIRQAAQSIKDVVNEMGKSIVHFTDTSTQLASTATNYKDALLKSGMQHSQARPQSHQVQPGQPDPKILRDVDRKVRQILINTRDNKLPNASQAEIKEKVCAAINAIADPPPPQGNVSDGNQQALQGQFHNTVQREGNCHRHLAFCSFLS